MIRELALAGARRQQVAPRGRVLEAGRIPPHVGPKLDDVAPIQSTLPICNKGSWRTGRRAADGPARASVTLGLSLCERKLYTPTLFPKLSRPNIFRALVGLSPETGLTSGHQTLVVKQCGRNDRCSCKLAPHRPDIVPRPPHTRYIRKPRTHNYRDRAGRNPQQFDSCAWAERTHNYGRWAQRQAAPTRDKYTRKGRPP